MTTIAYHQYSNIPNMGGSYASAPVIGPLSTNKTPLQMKTHNHGVLTGQRPNPPQYYPSDGASVFSIGRQQYRRTRTTENNFGRGTQPYSTIPAGTYYSGDLHKRFKVSQSTKYVAPASSGLYLSAKKSAAIGKSSLKQSLPNSAPLTYKNYNQNDVKTALRKVRGGGTVAPMKKGAIANIYKPISPLRSTYTDALYNIPNYVDTTTTTTTNIVDDRKNIFSFASGYPESNTGYYAISTTSINPNSIFVTFTQAIAALNSATSLARIEQIVKGVNDTTLGDYDLFFSALNDKISQF